MRVRRVSSWIRSSSRAGACLTLVAGLLVAVPDAAEARGPSRPATPVPPGTAKSSVPGRGAPAVPARVDPDVPAPALTAPVYPAARSVTVSVPSGSAAPVRVGDLPMTVAGPKTGTATPAKVTAQSLDRTIAAKLGGPAMAVLLRRADGQPATGPVRVSVDYSRFAQAAGGDYADRLRLVKLPAACATAPTADGCGTGMPVPADNNVANRTLTATVDVSGDGSLYTVDSASSSASGDYRATDLNVAQKWTAGESGGAFDYTYPIDLPSPPYGEAPDLALSYDSAGIDGRTSKHNSQASWVGQGWDVALPYIERQYKSCSEDGYPSYGDLCWSSPDSGDKAGAEYVISIGGHTSELLKAADGTYRMKDDQSYRIEHHTGGPNGDNDGEFWEVSTLDGTQYFLGYGQDQRKSAPTPTNSNWTVPVVSDDAGEPCHQSNLASCQQTYRWNVDEVHSPNETYQVFYYETESNTYKRVSSGNDLSYIRGGYLSKIEYGKLWAVDDPAPAYVSFTHYNRCTQRVAVADPDSTPEPTCPTIGSSPSSYPDVPTDLICSSGCSKHSPTFFVSDMLDSIQAYTRNPAGAYDLVTKWQLKHSFPATGDGSDPSLWLDYVRRIGYVGGTIRQAVTSFDGTNYNNRVDYNTSLGVRPLSMRRLTAIHNAYGGETVVAYGHQNGCFTGGTGASGWSAWYKTKNGHWDTNTDECFPEFFKPEGASAGWGIFHKYVVLSVTDVDHVGGQPSRQSAYTYLGGAAWHHDDDLLTADDQQSWSDWRGYGGVRVTEGSGANVEKTVTATTYFRGMDQDVKVDGTNKNVSLTDYDQHAYVDGHYLRGLRLQEQRYRLNADGTSTELAGQRWTYWDSGITANGPGLHNAHMIRPASHLNRDLLDNGTWRVGETDDTYDTYGLVATETDQGDKAVATDTTCVTTAYARNTADWRWMIDYPETVETHKDSCTGPVIGRTVNLYDNATSTDDTVNVPIDGNVTEARAYLDNGTYSAEKTTYDEEGRVLTKTDPLGHTTKTVYTPATGYPTGGVTVTNPLGQATTTWTSPAFDEVTRVSDANHNVTEKDYDALGRITAVWLPTEPLSAGTPSYTYAYLTPVSGITAPTGPTLITTKQLQSSSVWLSSYEYDDGFAEPVETQTASPQAGGREVTTTRYDSRGLKALESGAFYNAAAPGSGLLNPAETAIPTYTTTSYDAFEQPSAVVTRSAGSELWRSTTTDHGDHTVTVPPTGGQVVTWTDVFDKTTKVQDYLDATRHQDTTYTYTADHDDVATVSDPDGNVTSYGYDWQHHRVSETDPDSGAATTTYDLAGNATSTVDAKGQKISTGYDGLNRQTSTWSGNVSTGTQLTALTYDSVPGALGQVATSTTYTGGQAYVNAVTSYDARYRVTGRRYTIPAAETGLGGTYDFGYGYDQADHQTSITYPAAGGLARETVTERYTSIGLPNTLIGAATYVAGTTFAGDGKLSGRQYSDTVQRQYGYEPTTDRLSTIKTVVNGAAMQNDEYRYDHAGDTTTIIDHVANQYQCFGYDGRQRLTGAYTNGTGCSNLADGTGPAPYNLGYSYDGAGDITTASSNGVATGYTYPAPGAGVVRPHAVTAVGSDSYAYDANGELASRTVDGIPTTFTWNALNQLATSTTVGKTSSYGYDAGGDRLLRRDPGSTTLFLDNTELTSTNGAAPTATRYYTAAGATVAQRTPSALTWLTADRQGSEDLAITAAGAVTRQRYLPYGGIRGATGQVPGDRGFLGQVRDSATSLDLLGSRYYDATIGRFIMPDPVDNTDNPDSANPYAYAVDNPATTSDPSGLMVPCESGHGGCGTTGHPGGAKSSGHHSSHHSSRHSSHHSGHVTSYSDWCYGWVCNPGVENTPQIHPAMPCAIGDPNPFCNQYQTNPPPVSAQPPKKKEHHSFWDKVKSVGLSVVKSRVWQGVEVVASYCGIINPYCAGVSTAMSGVDTVVYAVNGDRANAIRSAAQVFTYGGVGASDRIVKGAWKFMGAAKADSAALRAAGHPATRSFVKSAEQRYRTMSSVHTGFQIADFSVTTGAVGGQVLSLAGYGR